MHRLLHASGLTQSRRLMTPTYLGELVKLHPRKVLNNNSVHTYINKILKVGPAAETSRISGATTSEQQSNADNSQSLHRKPEKEADEMKKPEKAAVEKPRKKKEKVVQMVKKQKMVVQQPVEARIQASPVKSKSGTSSEEDSHSLAKLKRAGAQRKLVV
ncbi:hypothetical protein F511_41650 [Dorcoceras hygrometricum]|uniref:Uncharacterized protein n=1 Tax=Dorcoceras hygrometricum TaxID=472368 RepID=A0A2Z7DFD6_9LAMI|nr:hypothetical protein F511_41650 [Dorcoceras hygrometricum]